MKLRNEKAASAPNPEGGSFSWKAGETVEVPDEIAAQLIAIKDGGFYNPADHGEDYDHTAAQRENEVARNLGPKNPNPGLTKVSPFPSTEPADASGDSGEGAVDVELLPPPKSGKGSGVGAWREYADAHKIAVSENAKAIDIITALDEAGVMTELPSDPEPDSEVDPASTDDGDATEPADASGDSGEGAPDPA